MALFDTDADRFASLDEALFQHRYPLTDHRAPREAGTYLVFYDGPLRIYAPVAGAVFPVYVGAAYELAERVARHRRNTRAIESLAGGGDLYVLTVPTGDFAGAIYAEELLRRLLLPVWNEPFLGGFGSRAQGATRTRQSPPPWSLLHPGRAVGLGDLGVTRREVETRACRHLEATARPLWPAL